VVFERLFLAAFAVMARIQTVWFCQISGQLAESAPSG
jgi:hypothetical protein